MSVGTRIASEFFDSEHDSKDLLDTLARFHDGEIGDRELAHEIRVMLENIQNRLNQGAA